MCHTFPTVTQINLFWSYMWPQEVNRNYVPYIRVNLIRVTWQVICTVGRLWHKGTSSAAPSSLSLSSFLSLSTSPAEIPACAFTPPWNARQERWVRTAKYRQLNTVRGAGIDIFSAWFVLQRRSREKLPLSLCATAWAEVARGTRELRDAVTARGVIEREEGRTHISLSSPSDFSLGWTACPEMASPAACRNLASAPPREQEPMEPNHPEPACLEAQKWIEVSERTINRHCPAPWCCNSTPGTDMSHTATHCDRGYKYSLPAPVHRHLLEGLCSVGLPCGTAALLPAGAAVYVKSFDVCSALI